MRKIKYLIGKMTEILPLNKPIATVFKLKQLFEHFLGKMKSNGFVYIEIAQHTFFK